MTPWVDGPLGVPPSAAREMSVVGCSRSWPGESAALAASATKLASSTTPARAYEARVAPSGARGAIGSTLVRTRASAECFRHPTDGRAAVGAGQRLTWRIDWY